MNVQLAVIGAGPAGLAAAIEAKKSGIENIVVLEREAEQGGILKQCIHTGFGLHLFGEELTGPEYAERFIIECKQLEIPVLTNTMVLSLQPDKTITAVNSELGVFEIKPEAVVLSTGCRERPRGSIMIPGSRPAGVFTAGTAQKYVNIDGFMPGREVVILGSGDIGLIMARRMTLEGAQVKAVLELKEFSAGLKRNIVQCLDDFGIPLMLSHTVIKIHGDKRIAGVTTAAVDKQYRPIPGTEEFLSCDTLLLSVGLIPENELARSADIIINERLNAPVVNQRLETSIPGIFACGNALHVHDLADYVTLESRRAGKNAADYIKGEKQKGRLNIQIEPGKGLGYILPYIVDSAEEDVVFSFRSDNVYRNVYLIVSNADKIVYKKKIANMTPGEMEQVTLKKELISEIDGSLKFLLQEVTKNE